jgi:hypothetical protein
VGPHGQVAAAGQALRVEPGGPVEGGGDRGPPIDDEGLAVLPRHRQPADVERLAGLVLGGGLIDPAEAEPLVPDVELGQSGQAGPDHDVPLRPRLGRAALAQVEDRFEHPPGFVAHGAEARVSTVEESLLFLELGIDGHVVLPVLPLSWRPNRPIAAPSRRENPSTLGPGHTISGRWSPGAGPAMIAKRSTRTGSTGRRPRPGRKEYQC